MIHWIHFVKGTILEKICTIFAKGLSPPMCYEHSFLGVITASLGAFNVYVDVINILDVNHTQDRK